MQFFKKTAATGKSTPQLPLFTCITIATTVDEKEAYHRKPHAEKEALRENNTMHFPGKTNCPELYVQSATDVRAPTPPSVSRRQLFPRGKRQQDQRCGTPL